MPDPRVLVVEDDRTLAGMLDEILTDAGYATEVVHDGQRALHLGLTRDYDVLVVDRGLPAIEGLDLLGRLRSRGITTPALVLSALGSPADVIDGLDAGAADYVSKPFDVEVLLARLRALRRRTEADVPVLRLAIGELDVASRRVRLTDGRVADLSPSEALLLETLARHPNQVFSRGALLDAAFTDAEDDGSVDTYVHYLRRKLGRSAVRTVRGVGYALGR